MQFNKSKISLLFSWSQKAKSPQGGSTALIFVLCFSQKVALIKKNSPDWWLLFHCNINDGYQNLIQFTCLKIDILVRCSLDLSIYLERKACWALLPGLVARRKVERVRRRVGRSGNLIFHWLASTFPAASYIYTSADTGWLSHHWKIIVRWHKKSGVGVSSSTDRKSTFLAAS